MKIFTNLIFSTFVCFAHFECAVGSGRLDLNIPLDCDGEPVRTETEHDHSPAKYPGPVVAAAFRERSRSPLSRVPSAHQLGEFGYKRLIPRMNSTLTFEFRKYIFPEDILIKVQVGNRRHPPMLEQEYIVFSTTDDEVFATVENMQLLRGLYNYKGQRIKVHMRDATFERMTPEEILQAPVDPRRIFRDTFRVITVDHDSLKYLYRSIQSAN